MSMLTQAKIARFCRFRDWQSDLAKMRDEAAELKRQGNVLQSHLALHEYNHALLKLSLRHSAEARWVLTEDGEGIFIFQKNRTGRQNVGQYFVPLQMLERALSTLKCTFDEEMLLRQKLRRAKLEHKMKHQLSCRRLRRTGAVDQEHIPC